MKKYITMYLDSAPKIFDKMSQYLTEKNFDQLRIAAHSLKPQSEYMGLKELKETLDEIEQNINGEEYEKIPELLNMAYKLNEASTSKLKQFIKASH